MKFLKARNLSDILAGILTFLTLVMALLASVSPYVHPQNFSLGSIAGMTLPFILILSIFLFFYWIIRKEWLFLLPLLSLVINLGFIRSSFQIRSENTTSIFSKDETLKVISYNVHEFTQNGSQLSIGNVRDFLIAEDADIICFQEFDASNQLHLNELIGYFDSYPYHVISASDKEEIGMAIFSKNPVIRWKKVDFENTGNGYLWADIKISKQITARVINVHLQTTSLSRNNIPKFNKLKTFISNSSFRALQSESVSNLIDTTSHSVILCGDFNDTPASYTYEKIKGEILVDGFRESGSWLGGTYNGLNGIGKLFRIDYILHSPDFRSIRYTSPGKKWSDHKPVISELVYQN